MANAPRTMIIFEAGTELRKVVRRIVVDKDLSGYAEVFLPLLVQAYGDEYPELRELVAAEIAEGGSRRQSPG